MSPVRSAALLVRVWVEDGPAGVRGRLMTIDPAEEAGSRREVTVAVAATDGDVLDAVRQWLDRFVGHGGEPIDSAEPVLRLLP